MSCEARVPGTSRGFLFRRTYACGTCGPCIRAIDAADDKRQRRAARYYDRRRRPPLGLRRVVDVAAIGASPEGAVTWVRVDLACGHTAEFDGAGPAPKARVRCPECGAAREAA